MKRLAQETAGLEETPLMGTDRMFSPRLLEIAGPAADGLYLSAPALPAMNKRYRDFLGRYQDKYGELPQSIFVARSYDATMMILAAIERVTVQMDDSTLHIGRQALRKALFATRDFEGLTGNLTCTPHGDCAGDSVAVYQIVSADPDSWRPGSNPVKVWSERP